MLQMQSPLWLGVLPIYGDCTAVQMYCPNSPLFQLGNYVDSPIFSEFGM